MPTYPYDLTLSNPGFETGDATGWSVDLGSATVPLVRTPGHSGSYQAAVSSNDSRAAFYQDVVLPAEMLDDVDAGRLGAELAAYVSSYDSDSDWGRLVLEFYSSATPADANFLARFQSAELDPGGSSSTWAEYTVVGAMPSGTRAIRVQVEGARDSGLELSAYFDDFTLKATDETHTRHDLSITNPSVAATDTTGWTVSGMEVLTTTLYNFNPPCGDHFYGGTVATSYGEQVVDVPSSAEFAIDAYGQSSYSATAADGTEDCIFYFQAMAATSGADTLQINLTFLDASDVSLGTYSSADTTWSIDWEPVELAVVPPVNTRKVKIRLDFTRGDGTVSGSGICGINAAVLDYSEVLRIETVLPAFTASDVTMTPRHHILTSSPTLEFSGEMMADIMMVTADLPAVSASIYGASVIDAGLPAPTAGFAAHGIQVIDAGLPVPTATVEMRSSIEIDAGLPVPTATVEMRSSTEIVADIPKFSFESVMNGGGWMAAALPALEGDLVGAGYVAAELPPVAFDAAFRGNWRADAALPAVSFDGELRAFWRAAADLPLPASAVSLAAGWRADAALPALTSAVHGAAIVEAELPAVSFGAAVRAHWRADAALPAVSFDGELQSLWRIDIDLPALSPSVSMAAGWRMSAEMPDLQGDVVGAAVVEADLPALAFGGAVRAHWRADAALPAVSFDGELQSLWRIAVDLPALSPSVSMAAGWRMSAEMPELQGDVVGAAVVEADLPALAGSLSAAAAARIGAALPAATSEIHFGWQSASPLPAAGFSGEMEQKYFVVADLPAMGFDGVMYPHRSMEIVATLPPLVLDGEAFGNLPRFDIWRNMRP